MMLAPSNKRVKILDDRCLLRFVRYPELGLEKYGDCAHPTERPRSMRVRFDEPGDKVLETILHESIHVGCWWLDEEFVTRLAQDQTAMILRKDIRPYWDR